MSDDEEHDEYMGAELYAAERHAEAAESLLRDAVIRADAAEKRVAVLEEVLRVAANQVERLAFTMPPPNAFTPQFVSLAGSMRGAVSATTEGE